MACQQIIKILVILFLVSPACLAGDTSVIYNESDTVRLSLRMPQQDKINALLKESDYQYGDVYVPPESEGFLQRLWRKVLVFFSRGIKIMQYVPAIFKIIIVLSFIMMIFIIATKTRLYKMFYGEKAKPSPGYAIIESGDAGIDFDIALTNEISTQNYRNAVRLLHLKILKELERKQVIHLSIDKTNLEYTREIKDVSIKNEFIELTGSYNSVWYGKYLLSRPEFDKLAHGFQSFFNLLKPDHE